MFFGFFRLAQGRCDLGQKFWRQIFFQIFPDFLSSTTQKNFFFQFTADIERTARTEQSDNCHSQFVVSRCEAKKVWILLGICIRNCNQVQDVVAQLWRNFAPPNACTSTEHTFFIELTWKVHLPFLYLWSVFGSTSLAALVLYPPLGTPKGEYNREYIYIYNNIKRSC